MDKSLFGSDSNCNINANHGLCSGHAGVVHATKFNVIHLLSCSLGLQQHWSLMGCLGQPGQPGQPSNITLPQAPIRLRQPLALSWLLWTTAFTFILRKIHSNCRLYPFCWCCKYKTFNIHVLAKWLMEMDNIYFVVEFFKYSWNTRTFLSNISYDFQFFGFGND